MEKNGGVRGIGGVWFVHRGPVSNKIVWKVLHEKF